MTTEVDVIREIELAHEYAKKKGHTNSQLKALELLSKVRGTKKTKAQPSPEELEESLINSLYVIGTDKVRAWCVEADKLYK